MSMASSRQPPSAMSMGSSRHRQPPQQQQPSMLLSGSIMSSAHCCSSSMATISASASSTSPSIKLDLTHTASPGTFHLQRPHPQSQLLHQNVKNAQVLLQDDASGAAGTAKPNDKDAKKKRVIFGVILQAWIRNLANLRRQRRHQTAKPKEKAFQKASSMELICPHQMRMIILLGCL
uniref:Uncharacterized protein n=1 Tax=Kalanchoe fedtschenkoi TaxID=63787 RepID=A0A7N0VKV4_KALFE